MKRKILGVMGPGENASAEVISLAFEVGKIAGEKGYDVLTGGRNIGVMDSALKGAKSVGALTIGILPDAENTQTSEYADVEIYTGMGQARNVINVLSSDIIVAVGMGPGTASEVSIAIKHGKKLILISQDSTTETFFKNIHSSLILCDSVGELENYL